MPVRKHPREDVAYLKKIKRTITINRPYISLFIAVDTNRILNSGHCDVQNMVV